MFARPETILVIDDDQDILDLLLFNFQREGYRVCRSANGREGLDFAIRNTPDLLILDIMLPGISGTEVLRHIRQVDATRRLPVLVLSARSDHSDRILAFELGADDYVTKPFSTRELVLRVRNLLARFSPAPQEDVILRCDGIVVDCSGCDASVRGRQVGLTATEFHLLVFLMRHRGRVITRDQVLDGVWGTRYDGTGRTVDTHVHRLKEKLGEEGSCIQTIRGVGYKIE